MHSDTPDHTKPEMDRWFLENVKCHERMVRAWISSRFSSEQDIEDILQEAYYKIYEAHSQRAINSPKAYLFAIVRSIIYKRVKYEKVANTTYFEDFDVLSVLDNHEDVSDEVAESEELELLTKAIQTLPKRCRQVLTLMKIYGISQKEAARELAISVNTVENQISIGMKKLSHYFERYKKEF